MGDWSHNLRKPRDFCVLEEREDSLLLSPWLRRGPRHTIAIVSGQCGIRLSFSCYDASDECVSEPQELRLRSQGPLHKKAEGTS
jgi:hypothetical protein